MENDLSIVKVPILPFNVVNAFIVRGKKGCIIVDTSIVGSSKVFAKKLKQIGMSFNDVKLIVVTHPHTDHAGSAFELQKLSGAPIISHEKAVPYFNYEKEMSFCSISLFGRLFYLSKIPQQVYEGFVPNITLKEGEVFHLQDYGFDGEIICTPGHSEGDISVFLRNQRGQKLVLAGDLAASGILMGGMIFSTSKPIRPPFELDPNQVANTLQNLIDDGGQKFYVGHGGPINAEYIQKHIGALRCAGHNH